MRRLSCPYCQLDFTDFSSQKKSAHIGWCSKNPAAKTRRETYKEYMKVTTLCTHEERSQRLKAAHAAGKYNNAYEKQRRNPSFKGKHHLEESKKKISEKGILSGHRRLVKSCRIYTRLNGNTVLLDSSWEELLAKRLDFLGVEWIRPGSIQYELNGVVHRYFPDFYLPEYDLYLDPKNPQAIRVQKEKIDILLKTMKNLIILKTKEECELYCPHILVDKESVF